MAAMNKETPLINEAWCWLRGSVVDAAITAKKLGEEDPRKIIHSLKVGLAITIVSLLYYFEPLFDGFGVAAMWAVITVVVVFEFSVGATLGKGVNRGIATCLGCGLGVGAHRLASVAGDKFEPLFLGLSVFIIAALVTFARFLPKMKARYDYGLLIFILSYSLISVSAYRDEEVLAMANSRLSTILVGGSVTVIICVGISPVWAGDDLHHLISSNIEKLAISLQVYGAEYFKEVGFEESDKEVHDSQKSLLAYKSVLDSKITAESLANFAKWEPRHGRIKYRHPWEHYLKIGALTQQCAYIIQALNVYLSSEAPAEVREKMMESCMKMSLESGKAMMELATTIKTMTSLSTVDSHIESAKMAAEELKTLLRRGRLWEDANFLTVIPAATVALLLIDVVICTERIAEAVHELALLARFSNSKMIDRKEKSKPFPSIENAQVSISVE